jgi:transposase, IS5 family
MSARESTEVRPACGKASPLGETPPRGRRSAGRPPGGTNSLSRSRTQAKRFAEEVASGRKRARGLLEQIRLQGNRAYLERMIPRVRQVMHRTRERLFKGNTHVPGKLVSLFEPHTEVIRQSKAAKPTEFGKMVKIQETEAQIVTHHEVYAERPNDCDLLLPAIAVHEQLLGRKPYLVTADAALFLSAQ